MERFHPSAFSEAAFSTGFAPTETIPGGVRYVWRNVDAGAVGAGVDADGKTKYSKSIRVVRPRIQVAVFGTFSGATVTFEGSWDGGTIWLGLLDTAGQVVSFTANGVALIQSNPEKIRYVVTGGNVATTALVILVQLQTPYHV